ncbi:MAG: hypothetical protein K0U37_00395 [Gammaproteobacteria bacterium]|nr:hypothetical protein [Gammaproteobacteria bacterium]
MPGFQSVAGYQPVQLSDEQIRLFPLLPAMYIQLEDADAAAQSAEQSFDSEKKRLIDAFLLEKADDLTALRTDELEALCRQLKADLQVDVKAGVAVCMLTYVRQETVDNYLDDKTDLNALSYPYPVAKRDNAIQLAKLFKPLITDIHQAHALCVKALDKSKYLQQTVIELRDQKVELELALNQTLKEALREFVNSSITPEVNQRQAMSAEQKAASAVRTLCNDFISMLRDEIEEKEGRLALDDALKDGMMRLNQLKKEHKADAALVGLLSTMERMIVAHQKNLDIVQPVTAEMLQKIKRSEESMARFIEQLEKAVKGVQALMLSDNKAFLSVRKTCDEILAALAVEPMSCQHVEKQLKLLLKNMGSVDLYKTWAECCGFYEMASYMVHALESCVRWLLECIYICSSTPEARITRENYFFKGPKKEVFDKFNQALGNLTKIEENFQVDCKEGILPQ